MADFNYVVVVGRLTRDPELKYTQGRGTPYTKLSMAINKQVPLPDGNFQKATTFVDVAVWKHQAELACQVLKKGSTCLVSGELELMRWTDAQNQKRSKMRVRCHRLQFLDKKAAIAGEPVAAGVEAAPGGAAEAESSPDGDPDDE